MNGLEDNPFRPGAGMTPVHRAGHEEAAERLAVALKVLRTKGRGDVTIMFGPRGNGKTALLDELRTQAEKTGVRVVSLITSTLAGDPAKLARLLVPRRKPWFGRVRKVMAGALGYSAGIEFADSPEGQLEAAFREALGKSPLALIVDEAHDLPPGLGKTLLQITQACLSEGLPLLVTLAGTPGLPFALRKTGAGFWERYRRIRIDRLETDEAARQAFTVPSEGTGCPIDEDALDLLVRESQRYPYFVQELGWHTWLVASKRPNGGKGGRRITIQDAEKGIKASKVAIWDFYQERHEEVENLRMLGAAVAVSEAMMTVGAGKMLAEEDLRGALRTVTSDEDSLLAARNLLSHLGLVWKMPEGHWEPGIPSLCKYIASRGTGVKAASDSGGGVALDSETGVP